ncbi:hypothetical protein ACS0TY_026947 [Phlomoides rotata]
MSRGVFSRFCHLLETSGGLKSTRNCTIAEQAVMFLSILAHHTKNRIVKSNHLKSGRTVSKHLHRVLNSVIRLHSILFSQPKAIYEITQTGGGDTLSRSGLRCSTQRSRPPSHPQPLPPAAPSSSPPEVAPSSPPPEAALHLKSKN